MRCAVRAGVVHDGIDMVTNCMTYRLASLPHNIARDRYRAASCVFSCRHLRCRAPHAPLHAASAHGRCAMFYLCALRHSVGAGGARDRFLKTQKLAAFLSFIFSRGASACCRRETSLALNLENGWTFTQRHNVIAHRRRYQHALITKGMIAARTAAQRIWRGRRVRNVTT